MNAEVISVTHDGALVWYYADGDTEHFDSDYFTDKEHHPDDEGYGVWKIRY